MKKKSFILIALIAIISCAIIFSLQYNNVINKKIHYSKEFEVKKGDSAKKIFSQFKYGDSIFFKIFLKTKNNGKNIKAGYYELKGNYSLKDIMKILDEGLVKSYKFTIIEGQPVQNVIDKLSSENKIDKEKFLAELKNINFPYPTPNNNFEGYFYPETYIIPEKSTEKYIINLFLNEFLKKFPPEQYANKEDFYQKLILASIIEREAYLSSEKPIMASVFYNRLKKGMKLAADSTVNYVFNYSKKRIFYKDLEVDSPYNTYKNFGLPPAPICNPTKESVDAVYNPSQTDYLFFVAKGDGSHFFSKTYKEHLDFQKNNKK